MNNLPLNWSISTLGVVCSYPQYGWTCKASKQGKLKILRTTDISKTKVDWDKVPFCSEAPEDPKKYRLVENDLLVSRAGSVGVSYRIEKVPFDAIFASYLIRFKPLPGVLPKFIEFYLKSDEYWKAISEFSAGIAIPNINASKLSDLPIPVAPLNEQHRIVAKLEKLLTKVDQCKARLEKIPTILKRFRQAVLTAACSGELTREWRNTDVAILTGEELLQAVLKSKKDYWTIQQTEDSNKSNHVVIKRLQHKEPLPPATDHIDSVPKSWIIASPDQICTEIVDCPHSTPEWTENGFICLRTTNFKPGVLDLGEVNFVSQDSFISRNKRLAPQAKDVVYSREGGILGIACMIPEEVEVCLGQRMMLLRANSKFLIPEYLMHVLNSPLILSYVKELTGGSASPHLNVGNIKRFALPLPPIEEQKKILNRIKRLFDIAGSIESRYQLAKTYIDNLTLSILAKAFRGELVPQDPNDEPASELLKRIQAERERHESEKPERKFTTRKQRKSNRGASEPEEKITERQASIKIVAKGKPSLEASPSKPTVSAAPSPTDPEPATPMEQVAQSDIMAAMRQICRASAPMTPDDLLRQVAQKFGRQRLSAHLKLRLQGDLHAAKLRKIVQAQDGLIIPATIKIDDYEPEMLLKAALAVLPKGREIDETTALQATIQYLGFKRLTDNARDAIAAVLRKANHNGLVTWRQGMLGRI